MNIYSNKAVEAASIGKIVRPEKLSTEPVEADGPSLSDQLVEKGIRKWANEQKMENLRKRLRQELEKELGLTADKGSNMDQDQLASARTNLELTLEERLRKAVEEAMKLTTEKGKATGQPMIIDVAV